MPNQACVFLIAVILFAVNGSHADCLWRRFITFNTALTPFFTQYDRRAQDIPSAIEHTEADVICLQEVWFERDIASILDLVKHLYPYHYSTIHGSISQLEKKKSFWENLKSGFDKACGIGEGAALGWCSRKCDKSKSRMHLLKCLKKKCRDKLTDLSLTCRACLSVGADSVLSAIRRCGNFWSKYNRFNPTGLLLLSKHPIYSAQSVYFQPDTEPVLFPRGYLKASVRNISDVFCTQLSGNIDKEYLEFSLRFSSYEEQQRYEIKILNTVTGSKDVVVLGSVGTGPKIVRKDIEAEFPANYNLLLQEGFYSPYVDNGGTCTFCGRSNPLLDGRNRPNVIIDHILLRQERTTSSRTVLRTYEGRPLSDHYGVEIEACV